MSETVTGTCPRVVWAGFDSHPCGRSIKRDGLCGIHAAADDRMRASEKKSAEKRAASDDRQAAAQSALNELGIEGSPEYSTFTREYTGRVVISVETLRELAARPSQEAKEK